ACWRRSRPSWPGGPTARVACVGVQRPGRAAGFMPAGMNPAARHTPTQVTRAPDGAPGPDDGGILMSPTHEQTRPPASGPRPAPSPDSPMSRSHRAFLAGVRDEVLDPVNAVIQ